MGLVRLDSWCLLKWISMVTSFTVRKKVNKKILKPLLQHSQLSADQLYPQYGLNSHICAKIWINIVYCFHFKPFTAFLSLQVAVCVGLCRVTHPLSAFLLVWGFNYRHPAWKILKPPVKPAGGECLIFKYLWGEYLQLILVCLFLFWWCFSYLNLFFDLRLI